MSPPTHPCKWCRHGARPEHHETRRTLRRNTAGLATGASTGFHRKVWKQMMDTAMQYRGMFLLVCIWVERASCAFRDSRLTSLARARSKFSPLQRITSFILPLTSSTPSHKIQTRKKTGRVSRFASKTRLLVSEKQGQPNAGAGALPRPLLSKHPTPPRIRAQTSRTDISSSTCNSPSQRHGRRARPEDPSRRAVPSRGRHVPPSRANKAPCRRDFREKGKPCFPPSALGAFSLIRCAMCETSKADELLGSFLPHPRC